MYSKFIPLVSLACILSAPIHAQSFADNANTGKKSSWALNVEPVKAFIENKGQFFGRNASNEDILFAFDNGSSQIFFTQKGLTYRFDKTEKNRDRKKGDATLPKYKMQSDIVNIIWEGANPLAKIVPGEKAEGYHSYAFYIGDEVKNINHIAGYKKITYKNLYPNIDIEYIFHKQDGIKYSVILHPGADVAKVKMKYSKNVFLNEAGEIRIPTLFGDIIEHAPVTFFADNKKKIASSFSVKNNVVSFSLPNGESLNAVSAIVIDPWVQSPSLSAPNCVWECETDGAGNVYIIGGGMPMVLQKFNSTGAFQWSYSTPWDTASNWLGTLATDLAGNSYITSGSFAAIQKINSSGAMLWSQGGGSMDEYWTISFNCDQTKLIVGGTRLDIANIANSHGVIFDINTNNGNVISFINVANARTYSIFGITQTEPNEVRTMSSSYNSKYYYLSLDSIGVINQNFAACSSEPLFVISSTYNFSYRCENYRMADGNSGIKAIRANDKFVYSLNGSTLHKRSLLTGTILASAAIPGGITGSSQGFNYIGSGGIDVDSCGNVYVGSGNGVKKYDANLNLISSASTSFAVYDVSVSKSGEVVVCGGTGTSSSSSRTGSVQSFNMGSCDPFPLICCDASLCPVDGPLCVSGSPVTIIASSPGGTWSGPGVNSSGVFNPATAGPGTHAISYSLSCGSDTVFITVNTCAVLTACQESNGNITATSGIATYTWKVWTPATSTPITTQAQCVACGYTWNSFVNECFLVFPTPAETCETPAGWVTFATGTTVTPPGFPILLIDANGDSLNIPGLSSLPNCSNCSSLATATNATCGTSNGTATANPAGTSPYTYLWSNGQSAATATGLATGSYTVTVTDNNGCSSVATAIVSSNPNLPVASISGITSICSGGTTLLTASGGDSYQWSTGATTDTLTVTPSANTTYIVTATNTCGSDTAQITVVVGGGNFSVSATSTLVTCGQCNATATATTTGGITPYTYSWSSGQTTQTISGLCSGTTYVVSVNEGGGCSSVASVNPGSASNISASTTTTVSSCSSNTGSATANVSGGISPYTYSWSDGQITQTAINLSSGSYLVTVTDSTGCTALASATVGSLSAPVANTSANNASCNGANDGTAMVNASGGTTPYSYLWSNGDTTLNISGLAPGNYYISVTDANNCSVIDTVTITDGGIPTASAGSLPTSCNGGADGSATVYISSGTSPYTYIWSSGDSIQTITGLSPGAYLVTVTDVNGCFATATTLVSEPAAMAATTSSVNASCGNSDGSATVSVSGGSSPYYYQWAANAGNQTTLTATGLAAGSFSVQITDSMGCTQTALATVSNAGAPTITVATIKPLCAGGTNGSATVTATGGSTPYSYEWSNGNISFIADSLAAGTYSVTVTDFATCRSILTVTINDTTPVDAQIVANNTVVCSGGSASLTAFGGSTYLWSTLQSGNTIQVTNILTDTTIFVTATNSDGCKGTDTVEITVIVSSIIITSPDTVLCPGENTTLIANGGNTYVWNTTETNDTITVSPPSDLTYSVSGSYGPGCDAEDSIQVIVTPAVDAVVSNDTTIGYGSTIQVNASGGEYYLWNTGEATDNITATLETNTIFIVTVVDANGCRDIDTINITVDCRHDISIPTVFSPNNDGINDFIRVHGYGIKELSFVVFDRWGEKVFEATERTEKWDGTFKGKALNSAVFVYILDVIFCDDIEYREKGNITLVR